MTVGSRPGGLTALAVLNFVFGGFGVIGMLFWIGILFLISTNSDAIAEATSEDQNAADIAAFWREHIPLLLTVLAMHAVSTLLQLLSGFGYLQQKRLLGRVLGNAYALTGATAALTLALSAPPEANGGFELGTIVSLLYPGLTLFLLNTTFKEDFVR